MGGPKYFFWQGIGLGGLIDAKDGIWNQRNDSYPRNWTHTWKFNPEFQRVRYGSISTSITSFKCQMKIVRILSNSGSTRPCTLQYQIAKSSTAVPSGNTRLSGFKFHDDDDIGQSPFIPLSVFTKYIPPASRADEADELFTISTDSFHLQTVVTSRTVHSISRWKVKYVFNGIWMVVA